MKQNTKDFTPPPPLLCAKILKTLPLDFYPLHIYGTVDTQL
jgi:hypothetical protein